MRPANFRHGRALQKALALTTVVTASTASAVGASTAVATITSRSAAIGCRGTALRGSFAEVLGSRAMGAAEFTLRLRNTSAHPCTLVGRPRLLLLDGGGQPLPTDVGPWRPSRAASPVTLRPGTSAAAVALVRVDIPDGRGDVEEPGQPCQPTAVRLRVSAAGGTWTVVPLRPATAVCAGGTILLRPFSAR